MSIVDITQLQIEFENAYPQDVLAWAANTYGRCLAVVTSFQPTGIVTLHMLSEIAPNTPVLTLDTGLLFPETHHVMNELEARLNLNLIRVKPPLSVQQQADVHGSALWETDPNLCCNLRKVVPLNHALNGYQAWITGLRRDQSRGRANTPVVAWDARNQRVKISPLATWTEDMIWAYIDAYELPYNELHDQGYPSIGCWPCTAPVSGEGYSREGRWASTGKIECGIHLAPNA
jgi:phosphoadenosine phosphosulfate reductase